MKREPIGLFVAGARVVFRDRRDREVYTIKEFDGEGTPEEIRAFLLMKCGRTIGPFRLVDLRHAP